MICGILLILLSFFTFFKTESKAFFSNFFSILIYKDLQFNNTKKILKNNSKIQVQNKNLRKPYTFLSKACTFREYINININTNTNTNTNNNNDKKL